MPKVTKSKSLETILANIEKAMGHADDPVIKKAPTKESFASVPVISFGYPEVDAASFCGGVPQGKMIEIFGPESGGKSFLTLKLIGSAQKSGMKCCLVDAENSYDPIWADQHGVDTSELFIVHRALSAEDIMEYVDKLCEAGAFGLIVVDSTAALIPNQELEGSIADQDYALLARVMSKACRKIVQHCATTNTTIVFVNQVREKMGVKFGEKTSTPGGRALKFYSHQRIKVNPGTKIKVKEGDEEVIIARQSWVNFVKNKVARPFGNCIIEIFFDKAATNPVVKLCKAAKERKIISLREKTFRINKKLFKNEKKNFDTATKTVVELADYLIKNDYLNLILDAYIEELESDDDIDSIDESILALQTDPSTIVSPLEGADVVVEKSEEEIEEAIEEALS